MRYFIITVSQDRSSTGADFRMCKMEFESYPKRSDLLKERDRRQQAGEISGGELVSISEVSKEDYDTFDHW
jgi:hypothetical protein